MHFARRNKRKGNLDKTKSGRNWLSYRILRASGGAEAAESNKYVFGYQ